MIISGIITLILAIYRAIKTSCSISILDLMGLILGSLIFGWCILPILVIVLLDQIKIK
jgi:hypothetical protein